MSNLICENCGSGLQVDNDNESYCSNCGSREIDISFCDTCGNVLESGFCRYCENSLPTFPSFCERCESQLIDGYCDRCSRNNK